MAARHEASDGYGHVIAISGCWRVVRCANDLQFIVQRRAGGSSRWPWQAAPYVLNESAIPSVLARASFGLPPESLAAPLTAPAIAAGRVSA